MAGVAKPKLLVLASTFPRHPGDGTPGFVLDLAFEAAREFEVLVLAPEVPEASAHEQFHRAGLSVSVHRYRYSGWMRPALADGAIMDNLKANPLLLTQVPLLIFGLWRATRKAVREFAPNVIHAHWAIPQGLVVSLLQTRVPMLLTTHGGDVFALNAGPLKALKRRAIRRAQHVTTVNHDMAQRLLALGADPAQLDVLPMGVDTGVFRAAAGAARRPNSLAFVGRLVEKKGLAFLLDALRRGLAADAKPKQQLPPDITLRVIGDGPLRAELEQAAVGLPVEFLGQRTQAEVAQLLGETEVFVLPSVRAQSGDQDGLPVSLLEAAAAGCYPVASDLPGVDAVVVSGENGTLVPPGDSKALAKTLRQILAATEHRAAAVQLMQLTIERFELESVGNAYNTILKRLAAAGEGR